MTKEIMKKAVDMLLQGATLVSHPCPYCGGVRVIREGDALCVSCGRAPDKKIDTKTVVNNNDNKDKIPETVVNTTATTLHVLEKKLQQLTQELGVESDHTKQQQIIKSIDMLTQTISRIQESNK